MSKNRVIPGRALPIARRRILQIMAASALGIPLVHLLDESKSRAAPGNAKRAIFFYFPDGVAGPSQDGEPSLWHCSGGETSFTLSPQLEPLGALKDDCVFLNGLSMGPTDSGSHPGGAKKLLTAADGGNNESIDQHLAHTVGASAPRGMLYLGAQANVNSASGDKHVSYISAGQSISPTDNPREAFNLVFPGGAGAMTGGGSGSGGGGGAAGAGLEASVIDAVLADMKALQGELGSVEKVKLDLHLEALREAEKRIKNAGVPPSMMAPASCQSPALDTSMIDDSKLYDPGQFPAILRAQIDLLVLAMQCEQTRVGTIQGSIHTSELIMSRFMGSEMYDAGYDMRSHQASHYGAHHDPAKREFSDYVKQRRWWVSQFGYLLAQLKARPEGSGTMLDNSVILLCTEICDGNTHQHDNMPFVLAGRAGGAIKTGRLLQFDGVRHGNLLVSIAQAMGENLGSFGDASSGPLAGLLS
jgi:hypothetical protein